MLRTVGFKILAGLSLLLFVHTILLHVLDRHIAWGNQTALEKWEDVKKHHSDCNTLFIGSSKTYRAVIPSLFDSLSGAGVKSYNLGIPAMFPVETYHFIERLLEEKEITLKRIFVELNSSQMGPGLAHIPQGKYFLDVPHFLFAIRAMYDSQLSLKGKLVNIKAYATNFGERIVMYGLLREYHRNVLQFDNERLEPYSFHERGFLSYEQELKHTPEPNQIRLGKKHLAMMADTMIIHRKLAMNLAPAAAYPNQTHLKKIRDLILLTEENGIQLVFYSMQQQKQYNNHQEVMALAGAIKTGHMINLSDSRKYPALFYVKNLYNAEHLNEQGAIQFTTYLAQAFNQL